MGYNIREKILPYLHDSKIKRMETTDLKEILEIDLISDVYKDIWLIHKTFVDMTSVVEIITLPEETLDEIEIEEMELKLNHFTQQVYNEIMLSIENTIIQEHNGEFSERFLTEERPDEFFSFVKEKFSGVVTHEAIKDFLTGDYLDEYARKIQEDYIIPYRLEREQHLCVKYKSKMAVLIAWLFYETGKEKIDFNRIETLSGFLKQLSQKSH